MDALSYRLSIAGLNTFTDKLPNVARRTRRINSSDLPENMLPQITSTQPFCLLISYMNGRPLHYLCFYYTGLFYNIIIYKVKKQATLRQFACFSNLALRGSNIFYVTKKTRSTIYFILYFFLNRSTRPPTLSAFCFPV